jgi:hypothetical protein
MGKSVAQLHQVWIGSQAQHAKLSTHTTHLAYDVSPAYVDMIGPSNERMM